MPGEYDFKGREHYNALLTHYTKALTDAAHATDIAKQDHLQRAKFYAQKLKEHPLHENIVGAVKSGAPLFLKSGAKRIGDIGKRIGDAVTYGSAETLKAGLGTPDNFNTPPGIATSLGHTALRAADYLSRGRISRAAETAAAKAKDLAKRALKKEDWAVGPQEGPTPVLAIQASRKKSQYKDPQGGELLNQGDEPSVFENATEEGDSRHSLDERRGLMRMALRGVRMARIRAQREAQKAAEARREAEAAAGGGGDDDGGPIDDQPMFRKPGSAARKFKTNEEKTEKPHAKGTRVVVSHKGHQKVGKVIRHDPGGPDSSPFYIVDVGEYGSHKVMAHNVRKEDTNEEKMTAAQKKKREEVAMAIERDKPGMPMGKKMAIATSVAMKKEGKVSSELPTNPKNLPLLKERDPSTGRLTKSKAARRVEEIMNCGKNKIDTEPTYNQLSPGSGGTGYVNT